MSAGDTFWAWLVYWVLLLLGCIAVAPLPWARMFVAVACLTSSTYIYHMVLP